MNYPDEKLKQLKERITWLITEKKVYQINVNYEELVALIHRLEMAERMIPKPTMYDDHAPCKRVIEDGECKDCELYAAWLRAKGE